MSNNPAATSRHTLPAEIVATKATSLLNSEERRIYQKLSDTNSITEGKLKDRDLAEVVKKEKLDSEFVKKLKEHMLPNDVILGLARIDRYGQVAEKLKARISREMEKLSGSPAKSEEDREHLLKLSNRSFICDCASSISQLALFEIIGHSPENNRFLGLNKNLRQLLVASLLQGRSNDPEEQRKYQYFKIREDGELQILPPDKYGHPVQITNLKDIEKAATVYEACLKGTQIATNYHINLVLGKLGKLKDLFKQGLTAEEQQITFERTKAALQGRDTEEGFQELLKMDKVNAADMRLTFSAASAIHQSYLDLDSKEMSDRLDRIYTQSIGRFIENGTIFLSDEIGPGSEERIAVRQRFRNLAKDKAANPKSFPKKEQAG